MPANRRETNRKFRQDAVLTAAQQVFAEHGLEGATMRAIAQAAGYTAGAVYSYYPTKEAIYAEILAHSLAELRSEITAAIAAEQTDEGALRAAIRAVYGFYRARPQDLDLGLYVFQGLRPRGLGPELDRQLNSRLIMALQKIAGTVARLGRLTPLEAHRETVAALCHLFGVLVMAGTGRLKILDSDPGNLIDHYLDGLVSRLTTRAGAGSGLARQPA